MSEELFAPGFASRHQAPSEAIRAVLNALPDFAAYDITARARGESPQPAADMQPRHFSPRSPAPHSFHPADPDSNPTEGWDPMSAEVEERFVDPIDAARQAGYEEGVAAALHEMQQNTDRDAALIAGLSEALQQGSQFDRERIARHLRATILLLVTRLVGDTGIDPDLLTGRIKAAVDMLADKNESAVLKLNPEDMPLVDGNLPATLHAMADASVERGGFLLESASTIVEDGPEQWLDQLAKAIDRVAVPPLC